jgi:SSS family solute:Na+ symporter
VAMVASLMFAILAVDSVGGMAELKLRLFEAFGAERTSDILRFVPSMDSPLMPLSVVAVYMSVAWWTDCGGFAAQRMFSTKDERESILSAIWYSIAHFALRPWPWIVVGLVALLRYPHLADPESGYPKLMLAILPTGLLGIMIASLLAAFMSTVDTHLNWNASYFVTDIYKRFIAPDADEARCVKVSRWSVVAFAALAVTIAYFMSSIQSAVIILFSLQAGIGLVLILRWFWWRINAWTEIAAMIGSLVVNSAAIAANHGLRAGWEIGPLGQWLLDNGLLERSSDVVQIPGHAVMAGTVLFTTPVWILVTLLTSPAQQAQLDTFYRQVRPARLFWGPVSRRNPGVKVDGNALQFLVGWIGGTVSLYTAMFAIGKLVLLDYGASAAWAGACALAIGAVWLVYRKRPRPLLT